MLKLAVLLAIVACAHASLVLAPLEKKPEKFKDQQGCYIKEMDAVIPFGQSRPSIKPCQEYRCGEDVVTISVCRRTLAVVDDDYCNTFTSSKPYPLCCTRVLCS